MRSHHAEPSKSNALFFIFCRYSERTFLELLMCNLRSYFLLCSDEGFCIVAKVSEKLVKEIKLEMFLMSASDFTCLFFNAAKK